MRGLLAPSSRASSLAKASWFRGARRDSDSQPTAEKATKGAEDTAPRRPEKICPNAQP